MKKITLLVAFLIVSVIGSAQTAIYVSATGDDTNDGLSTAAPVLTLNKAKDLVSDGDFIVIDGAGGVYQVTAQFNMDKNFTIAGINDAVVEGWASTGPRMFNMNADSHTVTIKNLTIQNMTNGANGNVFNVPRDFCSLTIDNVVVKNCATAFKGGVLAMTGSDSSVTVNESYFDGSGTNAVTGVQGGCFFVNNGGDGTNTALTITNSTIRNFSASDRAGALYFFGGELNLTNVTITDNTYTGASVGGASGIHIQEASGGAIQNSIIYNNPQPNSGNAYGYMDAAAAGDGQTVASNNTIYTQVTNGFRGGNLALEASSDNLFGDEVGGGAPTIAGFAFDAADMVYKFDAFSLPHAYGNATYLTELKDQRGFTRDGTAGKVDAGAWELSGYLGVESFEALEAGFAIYPNPVTSTATISAPGTDDEVVEIYSVVGQKVMEVTVADGQAELNVQGLKPGIYIAKLAVGNQSVFKRFVVAN